MKRALKLSAALFTGLAVFLQAKAVYAAGLCPPAPFDHLCALQLGGSGTSNLVGKIVQVLFILAVVLALLYLIYGGIKYITSGGDKAKIEAARAHITAAVVGLILTFAAYLILNLIGYLFGINITTLTIPRLF